jgi:transposase InsO family protein
MQFISRLMAGERMIDLCREFEISRKTGYKFADRYKEHGPEGLFDQSRKPHRLARVTTTAVREMLLAYKRKHPTWGPKKVRGHLETKYPEVKLPAVSTIADLFKSAGLVEARRRKIRVTTHNEPLTAAEEPNEVWCVDYKGQFRLGNGKYCYPLTVTDQFSRYFLACEAFEAIGTDTAKDVFARLFEKHGLPRYIRSDNGAPFASRGLLGLTRLSVFWIKHGVVPERIEPGHPEQNGRHERMHRTLKAETTRPAKANVLAQQERFDEYLIEFNDERPHEALKNKTPSSCFTTSTRRGVDLTRDYPLHDDVRVVGSGGHVNFLRSRKGNLFVSTALAKERIGLREQQDGRVLVSFANLDIGHWIEHSNRFVPIDSEDKR